MNYVSFSPACCYFFVLGMNMFPSTLFSDTLSLCCSLIWESPSLISQPNSLKFSDIWLLPSIWCQIRIWTQQCDHGGWHKQAVQKHCLCKHSPIPVVHGQMCSFVAQFQSSCCCWPSRVDVIVVDHLFHLNYLNQFSLGIWELCRHHA